ncbi:MAG TPA: NUDIX domain-containing protein [Anaerolineae bacterium]|nr:NUDIX domain-containing protein [Caldilineae bacterium]HID35567.1 NUDIX domain-containing protein [Anaerolineae bacterium]HIQ11735.1 NUDIX domain-containing protein [Caldilineales bacterium]
MNWRDAALRVLILWWRLTRPCTIGVRGVVLNDAGEMLLVRHSYGDRRWFLPGGGHHGGESPSETLVREMREETGLDVAITGLVGVYFYTGQYKRDHIYIFACKAVGGGVRLVEGEIEDIGWFPPDALPDDLMLGMDRILDDWRRGETGYGRIG